MRNEEQSKLPKWEGHVKQIKIITQNGNGNEIKNNDIHRKDKNVVNESSKDRCEQKLGQKY